MKTTLVFIGLKLGEVTALALLFCLASWAARFFVPTLGFWEAGAVGIVMLICGLGSIFIVVVLGWTLIASNWGFAKKLAGRGE